MYNRSGFLLLEVLLSLAITLVVLHMILQWMSSLSALEFRVTSRSEALLNACNLLEAIEFQDFDADQDLSVYKFIPSDLPSFSWIQVKVPIVSGSSLGQKSNKEAQEYVMLKGGCFLR